VHLEKNVVSFKKTDYPSKRDENTAEYIQNISLFPAMLTPVLCSHTTANQLEAVSKGPSAIFHVHLHYTCLKLYYPT
jgi:hypothetical protein